MTTTINASPTNGLVQTADGSGVLKVQSNGVTTNALAWGFINGTSGAIRASYNLSSVTRNSTGNYTLNFTNAMSDTNYTLSGSVEGSGGSANVVTLYAAGGAGTALALKSTTQCQYITTASGTGVTDFAWMSVNVFGN